MTKKLTFFVYGSFCYAVFFATFLYAVGFIGGFLVPTTLDGAPRTGLAAALAIDLGLLALFAVQHSVMARRGFKRVWTRFVPQPIERSTYVLFSSLALIALFGFWQPLGGSVWEISSTVGLSVTYALFAAGWVIVLVSTFLINHFDLFGMRQVWLHLTGREYTPLRFRTPALYRVVRHPLYVGWLLVFWATPTMTTAHLVFALMTTAYILVAIRFEERDLIAEHGERYRVYRKEVPMLVPSFARVRTEGGSPRQMVDAA